MSRKNVQTRKDVEKVLQIGEKKVKFVPQAKFKGPPYQLPTGRDVLERCIDSKTWKDSKNSRQIGKEIQDIWVFFAISIQSLLSTYLMCCFSLTNLTSKDRSN